MASFVSIVQKDIPQDILSPSGFTGSTTVKINNLDSKIADHVPLLRMSLWCQDAACLKADFSGLTLALSLQSGMS